MPRGSPDDLIAFGAVAPDRSVTRAAARLGPSRPAPSHSVLAPVLHRRARP